MLWTRLASSRAISSDGSGAEPRGGTARAAAGHPPCDLAQFLRLLPLASINVNNICASGDVPGAGGSQQMQGCNMLHR